MCHEYNIKRQDMSHGAKSKNQSGVLVPIVVTKTQNDPNENQCKLDFFANSAYETFNRTFGKSYMVFQRYVPCKGSNANVVRCVYNKDQMQNVHNPCLILVHDKPNHNKNNNHHLHHHPLHHVLNNQIN